MQLLSQHDQQEREQISELTVAANALKMDVAKNNYNMNYSFDRQTERRMIELIREQKDLIPEKYLHQSSIKTLSFIRMNLAHSLQMQKDKFWREAHLFYVVVKNKRHYK